MDCEAVECAPGSAMGVGKVMGVVDVAGVWGALGGVDGAGAGTEAACVFGCPGEDLQQVGGEVGEVAVGGVEGGGVDEDLSGE